MKLIGLCRYSYFSFVRLLSVAEASFFISLVDVRSQSITFRFSLFIFHFIVVFKEDPPRRRKVIIKLTVPHTPEEGE